MAALGGVDETPDSNVAPKAVVSRAGVPATKGGPMVAFEIRDIRVSSPEWRDKLSSSCECSRLRGEGASRTRT